MILRKPLPLLTLLVICTLLGFAYVQDKDEEGFVSLFNGKDLTGFVPDNGKSDQTNFVVEEGGVLHVNPKGEGGVYYIRTVEKYRNYVLRFDWKFPKPGNSGCFIHIAPGGGGYVEVQGWEKFHGEVLSAKDATVDREAQEKVIKVGEWNSTEITSKEGQISTKVNGVPTATGKAGRRYGYIGWQNEGAHVYFKNIRIKEMK